MRIRIVWAFLILFFTASYSQNGSIKGRVFNEKTNEPLEFATVQIQGT